MTAHCTTCSWEVSSHVIARAIPVIAPATALFFCTILAQHNIGVLKKKRICHQIYWNLGDDLIKWETNEDQILPNHERPEPLLAHMWDLNTILQPALECAIQIMGHDQYYMICMNHCNCRIAFHSNIGEYKNFSYDIVQVQSYKLTPLYRFFPSVLHLQNMCKKQDRLI